MKKFRGEILAGIAIAVIITANGAGAQRSDIWEDSLALVVQNSRIQHLPLEPLENKIREGRAKHRTTAEIYSAVKYRYKLLLQMKDNGQNTFTEGYTKQLFDLERQNETLAKPVKHKADVPLVRELHQSPTRHTPAETFPVAEREQSSRSPEKKAAAAGAKNGTMKQPGRPMDKADAQAEKAMEKAASRAEQRMESIQKRVQKRAMKRRGGGN